MSDLTKKTLAAITERHIQPVPFWVGWLENSAYWIGGVVLVVLSALVMSVSWHTLFEIDWNAYLRADFSWWQMILSGVPLFSFFVLMIFLWMSVLLLHRTRRGYRYPMLLLVGIFFSTSLVFGYFLEGSPLDEPTEHFLLTALPGAGNFLIPSVERQWSQPERGLLGGTVLSADATHLQLLDASQRLWSVDFSQVHFSPDTRADSYQDVKVIGNQEKEGEFRAKEIIEWKKTPREKAESAARVEKEKEKEKKAEIQKKNEEDRAQDSNEDDDHGKEDTDDEYGD